VSDGLAARRLYTPEARAYRPHATVARRRPDAKAERGELPDPEPVEFRGEALTLYQSRLRRDGARYEPLARFQLQL
jgi:2'-5' RNA ligase